MQEIKFLLARGFPYQQIAAPCGLNVMMVYRPYRGTHVPEIRAVYRHYAHTGRLGVSATSAALRPRTPPGPG